MIAALVLSTFMLAQGSIKTPNNNEDFKKCVEVHIRIYAFPFERALRLCAEKHNLRIKIEDKATAASWGINSGSKKLAD